MVPATLQNVLKTALTQPNAALCVANIHSGSTLEGRGCSFPGCTP